MSRAFELWSRLNEAQRLLLGRLFVLRRISHSFVCGEQILKDLYGDLELAKALISDYSVGTHFIMGHPSTDLSSKVQSLVETEEREGKVYYRRLDTADEFEAVAPAVLPDAVAVLREFPMSHRGLLDTLARE